MNFKNKKILVTGATGGIGDSIVKKFLSLDASVLGTGTNNEKLEALKKNYPKIETVKFDISEHEKIDEFIENVFSKLGGLDILILPLSYIFGLESHNLYNSYLTY